jgi:hypothetical protein
MSPKIKAILLNALVLPGLGQLYLGKKVKGMALIMIINLLLLLGLFVGLKAASPLIAARVASVNANSAEVASALDSVAGFGRGILVFFLLVWGYALIDIFRSRERGGAL